MHITGIEAAAMVALGYGLHDAVDQVRSGGQSVQQLLAGNANVSGPSGTLVLDSALGVGFAGKEQVSLMSELVVSELKRALSRVPDATGFCIEEREGRPRVWVTVARMSSRGNYQVCKSLESIRSLIGRSTYDLEIVTEDVLPVNTSITRLV